MFQEVGDDEYDLNWETREIHIGRSIVNQGYGNRSIYLAASELCLSFSFKAIVSTAATRRAAL